MAKSSDTLTWLYLLAAQSAFIFVLQAIIGFATNSLELKSDLVHSGIDLLTYGFNALVEWMKLYAFATGLRFLQPHVIDEVGSVISVGVLITMMFFVISSVLDTMGNPAEHMDELAANTGTGMVVFSLMTLVSNGFLLYLYKTWGLSFTDTTGSSESAPILDDEHGHGCCSHDHGKNEAAKNAEWGAAEWIHGLLHPGCQTSSCSSVAHAQAKDTLFMNLNLGAAMLHLVSDFLRTVTVLVSGVLINVHVGIAWQIDTYGALLIAIFNILGAGTLAMKAWKSYSMQGEPASA